MLGYAWLSIISLMLSAAVPLVLFVGRHWIISRFSRGMQRDIERLRSDLRKAEVEHKNELASKEADIAALRNAVLAGSAGRQALLDKRRFEAVERVWTAVNDLAQLKSLSQTMAIVNFKAVAKDAGHPKIQQFLSFIGSTAPADFGKLKNVARDEQPFLSESAWAYFHAYRSILYMNLARFMALKTGALDGDDPEKYFSIEGLQKVLIAALPHQTKFIEENEIGAYYYLLEEIEGYLLAELRKILGGAEADQASTARAKAIMDAVKEADKQAELKQAEKILPEALQNL